jgi:hypothetical protein
MWIVKKVRKVQWFLWIIVRDKILGQLLVYDNSALKQLLKA